MSCTWDPENRLIGVAYPDGTIETHTYSADGMRQKKVTSTGTIIYVRDGENVLIETNASLITQVQYTDFPGLWGGLSSERRSGVSSFYGFDQQENARPSPISHFLRESEENDTQGIWRVALVQDAQPVEKA